MNNWQELVPFYVAGMLSPSEHAAFEAFMFQSRECQQAVAEWKGIASAVREESESRSKRLPPLSKSVLSQMNIQPHVMRNGQSTESLEETVMAYNAPRVEYAEQQRISRMGSVPKKRVPRNNTPIIAFTALVAAAVMLLACAAGLFYALQTDDRDSSQEASRPKNTPTAIETFVNPSQNATSTTVGLSTLEPTPPQQGIGGAGGGIATIDESITTFSGAPAFVPSPTALPSEAPLDQDEYTLTIDRFGTTVFNEVISYPTGDARDIIQLELAGLTETDNYRELQITVYCIGENTEALRWYWGDTTSLENTFICGQTGSLVLSNSSNREKLALTFQENSPQSVVAYTVAIAPTLLGGTPVVTATPLPPQTAPQDSDPHIFSVQPDLTQQMKEALSGPQGDSADNITMNLYFANPGTRYEFSLLLTCTGYQTVHVRWLIGNSETAHYCGEEVPGIFFSTADNQKLVSVFLDDVGSANYVEYTLIAKPVPTTPTPIPNGSSSAPNDAEPHDFIVTRTSSNTFSDQVSSPTGDMLDRIHMTVSDMQPGEARNLEISMTCSGEGVEGLTWTTLVGQKTNTCSGTLYATLTDANNKISFDVTFSSGFSGGANVFYTLEVREAP